MKQFKLGAVIAAGLAAISAAAAVIYRKAQKS